MSFREAVAQSVFYIGAAIAFGVVFGSIAGWDYGAEYFAGWVVEKWLSVDNLFVFVIIMTTYFRIVWESLRSIGLRAMDGSKPAPWR